MNSIYSCFVKHFLYFLLLLPICNITYANDVVLAKDLKKIVEEKVLSQWQELGQRADSRSHVIISGIPDSYRSNQCPEELLVDAGKQLTLGRNSIQVSCATLSNWSLMLTAEIEVWREVVVIRDHLSRGERINLNSLTLQERNIGSLQRGYFTDLSDVSGNVSKRSLRAGVAIDPSMIDLPIIIHRGQEVTLRVVHPGLSVNMKGIALSKGRKGDVIKVKNSRTDKVLFGTIIHANLISIN